ncbi:hypothetical protein C8N24_5042 [Solirubrobacter pauli]|uniref:Uncharacterized protein n=1 Tax=Solirubrobacter pauli TaxID=166793 RepID=A0A660L2B1_9ACTN|nr:hypothetical protein [Solirubrobacter pauli]RKQ87022.1 hypothetical protein C8N24_5042 [Solirubrobacter pauli]
MTDTFPYPTGSVVAVFADDTACDAARRRLEQTGLGYDVLHGERGLARIDVDGEAHGRSFVRKLQSLFSDDGEHVREYAQHLRDGHYVVGVMVGEDEQAKAQAAEALRGARPESMTFYADRYVEDL